MEGVIPRGADLGGEVGARGRRGSLRDPGCPLNCACSHRRSNAIRPCRGIFPVHRASLNPPQASCASNIPQFWAFQGRSRFTPPGFSANAAKGRAPTHHRTAGGETVQAEAGRFPMARDQEDPPPPNPRVPPPHGSPTPRAYNRILAINSALRSRIRSLCSAVSSRAGSFEATVSPITPMSESTNL